MQDRGYSLRTTDEYARYIVDAGFEKICAQDETERFINLLQAEEARIELLPMPETVRRKMKLSWRVCWHTKFRTSCASIIWKHCRKLCSATC